jgi:hypothetical protein
LGLITDDSKGQIFSIDLLLALIPIAIVLGMVGANMDQIMYATQDAVFRGSTERVAADTLNTLADTSGSPPTWEINTTSNRTVGLAFYDTNKLAPVKEKISPDKLASITDADIQNLLGNKYGFFLNMTSSDGTKSWLNRSSGGLGYNNSAPDIVKVEKVVSYSKLNAVSSIIGQIKGATAIRDYSNPPDQFQTSYLYNQTYDYYVVVKNNGYTTANVTINGVNTMVLNNLTQPYLINSTYLNMNQTNPTKFYSNTVKVTAGSTVGNTMDLYIVQVKKGTSTNEITAANVDPQPCRFILYVWVK